MSESFEMLSNKQNSELFKNGQNAVDMVVNPGNEKLYKIFEGVDQFNQNI